MSRLTDQFLEKYTAILDKSRIGTELYNKYNVKRGLRNANGTGVLVGLTEIGNVHGYVHEDEEKKPAEGKLSYRGINVKELVHGCQRDGRFGFEETAFLLLFGYLPNQEEMGFFNQILGVLRRLPPNFTEDSILKSPSKNIMNKLARSVLVSYSYDPNPEDPSLENNLRQCVELIARFPTMVSYGYQAKRHYYGGDSLFLHSPVEDLSTSENFLLMTRLDKQYTQLEAEILDLILIIHAEHGGGNNSAFTTHVVSSSGTDIYSAISSAVGSLKGPLHGGANVMVYKMMEDIKRNVKNWSDRKEVSAYIEKILRKEAFDGRGLVYGMGHAIYTLSDPRAMLLKEKAAEVAIASGRADEFALCCLVEELTPEIFLRVKKNDKPLCANVDFYSGFVYTALNIDPELFTPLFAVSRIAGWCAHRMEELVSGGRIMRPAYKNVSRKCDYIPMESRN
ncbi:MAG: citrate/2-methylcitrate synthase [Spirochaetales bacterium]|nr:citrate/2-methylcitrate synthase [Spirochaetales bacterium]